MGGSGNGDKSKLLWTLIMVFLTVLGWAGIEIVQAKADIAALKTSNVSYEKRFDSIDGKLDTLLQGQRWQRATDAGRR